MKRKQKATEDKQPSHTIAFKDGARIEILENSDFLPYGLRTHHITFTVGGPGVERLYSADVDHEVAHGATPDLIDYLLGGINTVSVKFLKRFNVVVT